MRKLLLVVIICGAMVKTNAQTVNKPRLDSLLDLLATNNRSMGSLAIMQNGRLVYQKSIGYADIDSPSTIPATAETKYRIGSISKMFTGVMVMQLVEEGKLSVTSTLDKFYPAIPNAAKITIGMMMNHHSGLHNFTNDPQYFSYMLSPQTHQQMLARITAMKPDFEPGTKGQYSNTNFLLLSYIIEKISGKSYPELVKQRIINKIGLKDTYYGDKINTAKNEALPYAYSGKWTKFSETDMSIPTGAGSMVSTPADLDKFIVALFDGKLIKPASLELMKTSTDNYGSAMFATQFKGRKVYGHGGAIDAYRSELAYFPEQKFAVSYISNGGSFDPSRVMQAVYNISFNEPFEMPNFTAVKGLDDYIGVYSSKQIPLKINITKDGSNLIAQATGQSAFPLDATKTEGVFEFDKAGIVMEFRAAKGEFTLKQGGKEYLFTKE
ncbi:serine hydrolase domain-containing protein [Mucilaginibacter achroorhodeus]|nr:serine hydrolase domain-containing protein [Mucilaginibacter achroorhodeus]